MTDPKGTYGLKFTSDTTQVKYLAFRAPKAVYDNQVTQLGLEKIDTPEKKSKAIIVAAANYCQRVGVRYQYNTTEERVGYYWCAPNKFQDCLNGMTGEYRTGKAILKTFQPLDTNRN